MTDYAVEPFFLEGSAGRIFVLLRKPAGATKCVLFVPPFGEEMNKTRRQLTETARALLNQGFAVVLPDLYGTGDSEGDFLDARWPIWQSDIVAVLDWIVRMQLSLEAVLAVRLGCALAAGALQRANKSVCKSIFLQPVDNGRQHMTQFLRFRVAAARMESNNQETVEGLRQVLLDGGPLEVAGYPLSRELLLGIEGVKLSELLSPSLGELVVLEAGRGDNPVLSPASSSIVNCAASRGLEARGERVRGEPYWTSTEIVVNEELVRRTIHHLERGAAHEPRVAHSF